ncbi:hypothetical protein JD969_10650 [Planctomycetota bacterium]|nr:hypothetical protein JD969_10650 [Planctomycetota bacterium]
MFNKKINAANQIVRSKLVSFIAFALGFLLVSVSISNAQLNKVEKIAGENIIAKDQFIDELAKRCFLFFWEKADPKTGLIPDRTAVDGSEETDISSIAATGFGLTSYCIAEDRGWITRKQAYERIRKTLLYLDTMEHVKGYMYHFVNMKTGERVWECELSSIDTALLMLGVLTVSEHYKGTEVERLANRLYERVEWDFMLTDDNTLSMGWKPEHGFLRAKWNSYNELMMLYLLGLGSSSHPLESSTWHAWKRVPVYSYAGRTYLNCPPLFTHQYSQAYFDFENKHDGYADYWMNSKLATEAQRQFCIDLAESFPKWNENIWGLTASDGKDGYRAWGGPPAPLEPLDGTVVPCAPGGSIPFAPEICIDALYSMYRTYGNDIWKRYGLADAFNPHNDWVAKDVIGIDVGITLLMIANYQDRFVWNVFMSHPAAQRAMERAGFIDIDKDRNGFIENSSIYGLKKHPVSKRPVIKAKPSSAEPDWTIFQSDHAKYPVVMRFAFSWDNEYLMYQAFVSDSEVLSGQDQVELYIDPHNDGLVWQNKNDMQIILKPTGGLEEWHKRTDQINASINLTDVGYEIKAKISWNLLNVKAQENLVMGISPAILNIGSNEHLEKIDWHFKLGSKSVELGELKLVN